MNFFAVLTERGWIVTEHLRGKKRQNFCHFALTENLNVAKNIQTCWDIETYPFKIKVLSQSKKDLQAEKMLKSTSKFTGERHEMGRLRIETKPCKPNKYSSALGQPYLLDWNSEVRHIWERMVFATTSSAKPEKNWQSETCLQCCIKVQRSMSKQQASYQHDVICYTVNWN